MKAEEVLIFGLGLIVVGIVGLGSYFLGPMPLGMALAGIVFGFGVVMAVFLHQ